MPSSDHERIGPLIASHERAWTLRAAHHEDQAEAARTRKKATLAKHVNAPKEARDRMERESDREISHHETEGRKYRRRAAYAREGYVLSSPDEGRDADYQRQHRELHALARATGRLSSQSDGMGF